MSFQLPPLPYAFDALVPHIDAKTMEIHHGKHHAAYVTNLNNAIPGTPAENMSIEDICKSISKFSPAIRNNGGGHYNHSMFWNLLTPHQNTGGAPTGALLDAIKSTFTSVEEFKTKFANAGMTRFGSGWAWLVMNNGKLEIGSTPNQDNPIMDISDLKGVPLMCIDVWEHAYYLNYQNRRADYITAFWNVLNWELVAKNFAASK